MQPNHHKHTPPGTGGLAEAILTLRASDPHFDRNPGLLALRRALADRIEDRLAGVEHDLAILDLMGGDPDLEPSLGAPEPMIAGRSHDWTYGTGDDREADPAEGPEGDEEREGDAADDEPSLGSLRGTAASRGSGQLWWAEGGSDDREDGDDTGIGDVGGLAEQRGRHLRPIQGGAA